MRGLTFLLIIFTCVVLCACRESSPEKDFSQATAQRGSEKGIFASSALGDAKNLNRYYPVRAFDRDPLTAWGEGADGSGIGQFIGINFKEPVAADTIAVMAGFFDSRWHAANNRVKTATIFLDDVSLTAEFNESMTLQTVALGKTVSFKRFMLRIDAIYPGASYDDTCIAEIQFFLQGKEVLIDPELVKKADTKPITFSRIFEEKIRIRNAKTTRDGGYIACGSYHPGNVGETAMLLMKLDVRGNHVWTKHFGKKGTDNYGQYVQELAGGGYILCGDTTINKPYERRLTLIKTDTQGNPVWEKSYGETKGYAIFLATDENGYAVCTENTLIKTDTQGNLIWSKNFGGIIKDVHKISNGGYILGGDTEKPKFDEETASDIWLTKIDGNGNQVWSQTFGGGKEDRCKKVLLTGDKGYLILGWSDSLSDNTLWVLKTDPEGKKIWSKTFGQAPSHKGRAVVVTNDHGFLIAGDGAFSDTHFDVLFIKTDENGNKLWSRRFGKEKGEDCKDFLPTPDNGYLMLGGYGQDSDSKHGLYNGSSWLLKIDEYDNIEQQEPTTVGNG